MLHIIVILFLGISDMNMMFILAAAVIICLISIIRLLLEIYQLLKSLLYPYQHRLEYIFDLANWLEVPVYSFALVFVSANFSSRCTCIEDWEWSIGTLGVFLAWTSLVIYMRKLEFLGMFTNVKVVSSSYYHWLHFPIEYRYGYLCVDVWNITEKICKSDYLDWSFGVDVFTRLLSDIQPVRSPV